MNRISAKIQTVVLQCSWNRLKSSDFNWCSAAAVSKLSFLGEYGMSSIHKTQSNFEGQAGVLIAAIEVCQMFPLG